MRLNFCCSWYLLGMSPIELASSSLSVGFRKYCFHCSPKTKFTVWWCDIEPLVMEAWKALSVLSELHHNGLSLVRHSLLHCDRRVRQPGGGHLVRLKPAEERSVMGQTTDRRPWTSGKCCARFKLGATGPRRNLHLKRRHWAEPLSDVFFFLSEKMNRGVDAGNIFYLVESFPPSNPPETWHKERTRGKRIKNGLLSHN